MPEKIITRRIIRTAWEKWNFAQRYLIIQEIILKMTKTAHFIHVKPTMDEMRRWANSKWTDLPEIIKTELIEHYLMSDKSQPYPSH